MPAQSKLYATSPLSHVTQRWRARRHGLPRLLHTQPLSGACLAVSHAARSPQHETLARSDGLPAVCGRHGVGNGLPCPCDCAMARRVSQRQNMGGAWCMPGSWTSPWRPTRGVCPTHPPCSPALFKRLIPALRVSGRPSQPTTLQPTKSLPRYRHGRGRFTSSPWSMPANHGAQAHRASPPNPWWRSPPLVFLRARDPRNQPCLTCLCHRLGCGGGSPCAWPRCRPPPGHLHATRLHRRRRRRRGRSATRAYARAGSARNHDTSRRGIIDDHVSSQYCQQGHQGRRCHGL